MKHFMHRHSTLFGVTSSIALGILAAWITRVPAVFAVVTVGSLFVLPRMFYGYSDIRVLDAMPKNDDAAKAMVYSRIGGSANLLAQEYEDSLMRGVDAHGKPVNPTKGFKAFAEENDV